MNAVTQQEQTALTLPERASVALGSPAHEVKLRELVKASAAIVTVTNKAGRDECHTAYMTLKNTHVNINHTVDDVTEDAKAFTKAVKTEATRLVSIMLSEKERLMKLRDDWDEAEQARKNALIQAERERVENIERIIGSLVALPVSYSMATAAGLSAAVAEYEEWTPGAEFEEFADKAASAVATSLDTLRDMLATRQQAESDALAAEAARIAEAERLAAEKIALAAQKAENDRVAAEQKAEAQRLADLAAAQQAAALALQREAEAKAASERAAQQAIIDAQLAAMAEQSRKLAEQQAAADARDAAAAKQAADEQQREADHGPALMMNAEFDVARDAALAAEAERARLQALAERHVADEGYSAMPVFPRREIHIPTPAEIIELVSDTFDLSWLHAQDCLVNNDFSAVAQP